MSVRATLHPVVRADCLAINIEYCDRCMHAATQATNVARIKTKGTKGLLTVSGGWVRVQWKCEGLQTSAEPVARS